MPKYLIFNTVKSDGVGDFKHFEDIVKALNSCSYFTDVEFLLIVNYQPRHNDEALYESLRARISALGHNFIFGTLTEHRDWIFDHFMDDIIDNFADVSQAIIISYDDIFTMYEPYLPKNMLLKYVSEHDAETNQFNSIVFPELMVSCRREMHVRGMGLSRKHRTYGVKIKDLEQLTVDDALRVLQLIVPDFLDTLIKATGVADEFELIRKYVIVPAYFNYNHALVYFLQVLAANPGFAKDRDIIIYQSGSNLTVLGDMEYTYIENLLLSISGISTQVYAADNLDKPLEYLGLGKSSVKILVFSGFRIPDLAYQALYFIAPLVGISGDNTLELAIETKTLPFYWSTNSTYKGETYQGMIAIVNDSRLKIDATSRVELTKFFNLSMQVYEELDEYFNLDLSILIQAWPVVADYIKENHNFYNKLEGIVCEKLPRRALPSSKKSFGFTKVMLSFWGGSTEDKLEDTNTSYTGCVIS